MPDTDTQEQGPWTKYQPVPDEEEGPWKKYTTTAPSGPATPTTEAARLGVTPVAGTPPMKPQTETQFEKQQKGEDTGYWSGLKSAIPSIGSVVRRAAFGGFDPVSDIETIRSLGDTGKNIRAGAASAAEATPQAPGHPLINAINTGVSKVVGGGAGAIAPAVGISPVSQRERALRGDTGGILGEATVPTIAALTPVAKEIGGRVAPKIAEMRQPGRISNFMDVLRELTGKTPADLDFTERARKVLPDIAKVARESGFEQKGNARVGEFERQLGGRERQIWSEEHEPQIQRRANVPFDADIPAQRATAAVSKQMRADNPAAARAVDKWVASAMTPDAIGTIGKADKMMRSLNAANPDVPEPFKNLMRIAKSAAGDAIREQLETKLQSVGEEGVSNPNTRWGALREIRNLLQDRLNNAANRPLSLWDTMRSARTPMVEGGIAGSGIGALIGQVAGVPGEGAAIGGGIGATAGAAGSLIHDVIQQPGGRIARAMRGLAKTNLQPNEVQRPGFVTNPQPTLVPGIGGPDNPVPPPSQTPIGSILPVPQRPVGTLPTLSGPVTNQMWGIPEVQPKPGFEIPQNEVLGPWGGGTPPTEAAPTVAPMKPPLDFPPRPGAQEPLDFTKPATERRGATRQNFGPDFTRTALMNDLRKNIAAETDPEVKKVLEDRLADMKANPFEKHEGEADINRIKAMNKPTMTREEAEVASEERKAGRNQRFGEKQEGVLPGMAEHVAKQAEGAAKVKGEELTREINTPKNVDEAAGEMERKSPLFRGTAASPQGELLKPMEKPNVEEEESTDFPFGANAPEEEPVETEIKGITAKTKPPAKAKPVPIEKRFTPEEIERAELLVQQDLGMLQSMDRPGIYYDQSTEEEHTLPGRMRKGERMGGQIRGLKSGRNMLPFFQENPKFTPAAVEKALRNKDSAMYRKIIERAVNLDRRQTLSPEERADVERRRPSSLEETRGGLPAAHFLKKPAAD